MNDWQSTWLGRRSLPRDLSGFEIEAFFTFSGNERRVIEERRTRPLSADAALGRVAAGLERLRKDLRGASKPKERTPARPRTRLSLRARSTASRKRAGKPGRQVVARKTTRGGHRLRRRG